MLWRGLITVLASGTLLGAAGPVPAQATPDPPQTPEEQLIQEGIALPRILVLEPPRQAPSQAGRQAVQQDLQQVEQDASQNAGQAIDGDEEDATQAITNGAQTLGTLAREASEGTLWPQEAASLPIPQMSEKQMLIEEIKEESGFGRGLYPESPAAS